MKQPSTRDMRALVDWFADQYDEHFPEPEVQSKPATTTEETQ